MAAAISRAIEPGASVLVTPTASNVGAVMAARAGLPAYVSAPEDAPESCIQQASIYGAEVELVEGLISDAGFYRQRLDRYRKNCINVCYSTVFCGKVCYATNDK